MLEGLQVVDISNPASPVAVGSFDTPDEARQLVLAGEYLYLVDRESGLLVIDIADYYNAGSIAGSFIASYIAVDVVVEGDNAFIAAHDDGLKIVDISDPSNPASRSALSSIGTCYADEISGNYLYTGTIAGIQVIDISDPGSPVRLSSLSIGVCYG